MIAVRYDRGVERAVTQLRGEPDAVSVNILSANYSLMTALQLHSHAVRDRLAQE
jgi:hypothetical protein